MKTYKKTHPWLNFILDLSQIEYTTWLLIGEAVSKAEHIAGVPLTPEAAEELHGVYLAKGALATTAIEGNTLTEDEVRQHLEGKLKLPPSRQYLSQEIDNIVEACNDILKLTIQEDVQTISPEDIRQYNKLVLRGLSVDEGVVPGNFRQESVMVGRYRGAPAEDCEHLLNKFCEWLNNLVFPDRLKSHYAILTAIAAHIYFVWIHPFGDGNGRTARLIEFRYLLQAGFPTPAAHLLSNFYNLTRTEYFRQLDKTSRSGGQIADFIFYATQGLVDQLRDQLKIIRSLQWETTWRNYVYERFGKGGNAHLRRRRLVLELSKLKENNGWINISDILDISPKLTRDYIGKTPKTLSRDLNNLKKMDLILQQGRQVKANKNIILAFLPVRASTD